MKATSGLVLLALIGSPVSDGLAGEAAPSGRPIAKAALVADVSAIAAGEPFTVALALDLPEGWHTYWRNPGESGAAGNIAWRLPAGFTAGELQWPTPERFTSGPVVGYGYSRAVWLLSRITPAIALSPGERVRVEADADWLVCAEICVPEQVQLQLDLPVGRQAIAGTAQGAFEHARAQLPQPSPWPISVTRRADRILVQLPLPAETAAGVGSATFFPMSYGLIQDAAGQTIERTPQGLQLVLTPPASGGPLPPVLEGVLALDQAGVRRRYAIRSEIRS
jgi:thiol:disulfide interchange protein DsbD